MSVSLLTITFLLVENLSPIYTESYDILNIPLKSTNIGTGIFNRLPQSYMENQLWQYEQNGDQTDVSDVDTSDNQVYQNDRTDTNDVDYSNDVLEGGDDKIVGGYEVDISLYPYHAGYGSGCGGAIIHRKWVITAAHCGDKPFVRVGSTYKNRAKIVAVKRHYIHPMYLKTPKLHRWDYDYQLLELAKPLKLGRNVQVVKLGRPTDIYIGKMLTVTGWGRTKEMGQGTNILRAVRLPVTSTETCRNVYSRPKWILTSRMFCAGYPNGKKSSCKGDSGGPAVAFDRLVGLVSFSRGCARPDSYGVYSYVPVVRDWIEKTTRLRFN